MTFARMIYFFGAFGLGLWLAGFLWFTGEVASLQPPANPRAAAIVVLTGGGGRVEEGLKLLAAGNARKLLVSGVHPEVDKAELLERGGVPVDAKLAACCIALGYAAGSTEGNATEAGDWAAREHIPSLIVVTASYHLPRALLEFHRVLPKVELVPYPLPRGNVAVNSWWQSGSTARLLIVEYAKYTAALARASYDLVKGA